MEADLARDPDQDIAERHAQRLIDAGLLTEREAQIYALRDICSMSRQYSADRLGVSKSRIDNALRSARQRLQNARETVAVVDDLKVQSEYPYLLDNINTRGSNGDQIGPIIDILTDIVDPVLRDDFLTDLAEEYGEYESETKYREAEAEHLAAIDAAIWEYIRDKSQEELHAEIQRADSQRSEEAAEMLNPHWLPMSEKAFTAVRDHFREHSDPEAYMEYPQSE